MIHPLIHFRFSSTPPKKGEDASHTTSLALLAVELSMTKKSSAHRRLQHICGSTTTMNTRDTQSFRPTFIFFCHIVAEEGGESPFAHSTELYDRVMEEMPEFVERVAKKGLNSPGIYRAPGKEGKNFVFTWAGPLAFGRDIQPGDDMATKKAKAEIQVRRLTPHFWWKDDDSLEVHQHVPALRRHPATRKPVWFNSLAGRYGTAKDRGATDPPYIGDDRMAFPPAMYEDGTPLEKKYLHRMWEISNEIQVLVKTEPGDLALVDNYQVSHSRAPWTRGDRKIMVSMWDTQDPKEKIIDY